MRVFEWLKYYNWGCVNEKFVKYKLVESERFMFVNLYKVNGLLFN